MEPVDIQTIIKNEISASQIDLKWPGRPLANCLVSPRKLDFIDSCNEQEKTELWLVFEEGPKENRGYMIVYSDEEKMFGLAIEGRDLPVFIGFYGSFVETLLAM